VFIEGKCEPRGTEDLSAHPKPEERDEAKFVDSSTEVKKVLCKDILSSSKREIAWGYK
jgi:hypothetical protein